MIARESFSISGIDPLSRKPDQTTPPSLRMSISTIPGEALGR
jgi:hypothetical protein